MNIYALLSLCASAICVSLGASVYFISRKSAVNRLFLLLMLANAYWAFCQFMISDAATAQTAFLWGRVLVFWPFLLALLLHFTLVYTESDLLKSRLVYALLYLSALAFSLTNLFTNWLSAPPVLSPWGYLTPPQLGLASRIEGVWSTILSLLALVLLVNYYNHVIDRNRKQQTKFVSVGLAIPIAISLITDLLFPAQGISFPVLGAIAGTFASLFIVYAMLRYDLFSFRSEVAAENVFSSMLDAILLVNLKGEVIKVNHALVALSGFEEKQILGKTLEFIAIKVKLEGNDLPTSIIAELQRRKEVSSYEVSFTAKSGQTKSCVVSASVVHDNSGADVGIALVLHDVTERKLMEQKLLKSQRLASIGELSTILGHDLRNPLEAIRTGSYYLRKKYDDEIDDTDRLVFDSIQASVDDADKIVRDLIDYASDIKLDLRNISAKALVSDALALVSKPDNVAVVDQTEDVTLLVDATRISQVFVNLVKNSFDAMPNGGKLTIKTALKEGMLNLSFTDTGVGMNGETLERMWTPLFTTKAKGMGFGLPICKRIVEAHNGKIHSESQFGVGTTVTVQLPSA